MDKNKVTTWINEIIQDLVNEKMTLENILRKTNILAYQIKNDNLKSWVKNEMDGYSAQLEIPDYRIVKSEVYGDFIQQVDRTVITKPNERISIELLGNDLAYKFSKYYFVEALSKIEPLTKAKPGDSVLVNLTHPEIVEIQRIYTNFKLERAWKLIPLNSIFGILGTIKNRLLTFLLELNDELGDSNNLTIMKDKNIIDKLFLKNMKAENINITVGDKNIINSSVDKKSFTTHNNYVNEDLISDLNELLLLFNNIKSNIDNEKYEDEITILENESKKNKPIRETIKSSLTILKSFLINIASNAATQPVLDKIENIISLL